jgi:phenylacetate-CoA ligase
MKKALSLKNLWDSAPPCVRSTVGRCLSTLPLGLLLGKAFRESVQFAEKAQYWTVEQSRDYQIKKIKAVLTLAYEKSSYYRKVFENVGFEPGDLKTLEDFRRLPIIDRNTIREYLPQLCTASINDSRVDYATTGGTGGSPLAFYLTRNRSASEYAYLTTSWKRIGYNLGMPLAVFRGRIVPPDRDGFYHEYDPLLKYHYYSNFHMTDDNIRKYIEHVSTLGPCFLHIYPSSGQALARFIRRNKLRPPTNIRGIIAESEIVYPEQRRLIEEVFDCRLFSLYGHSEKLILACECEHSNDYHVWPTYGYFELLDSQGNSVNVPGQRGEIVGTGFISDIVPFIRYRTGDFATYIGDHCSSCGRHHLIIRDIQGHRVQEMLIASDGSEISWTAMNMHDDTFDHVRQFQFYQDTPGRGILKIVPAINFDQADSLRIRVNLQKKFAGRFDFTIELCKEIPLSTRGKAIYVDQRITSRLSHVFRPEDQITQEPECCSNTLL